MFKNLQVGMSAYVCPAGSGPYSGEGWEEITTVKPDKFKAGNQWFSTEDGSPKTAPWGYHVSKIK